MSTRGLSHSNSNVSISAMSQGNHGTPAPTPRPLGSHAKSMSTMSLSRLGSSQPSAPTPAAAPTPAPTPTPAPAPTFSGTTYSASIAPLVPLKKLNPKQSLSNLPRVFMNDSSGLYFGVSSALTPQQREFIVKCVDNFYLQVLSYGNAWYCIVSALFADPCCILVNLLCCDFFVAIEDLPSALLCFKRVQQLIQDAVIKGKEPDIPPGQFQDPLSPLYPTSLSSPVILYDSDDDEDTPLIPHSSQQPVDPQQLRLLPNSTITEREYYYYYAYFHWLQGNMSRSLVLWTSLATKWPSDLFAVKRTQLLAFLIGKQNHMMNIMHIPPVLNSLMSTFQAWARSVLVHYAEYKTSRLQPPQIGFADMQWHRTVGPILNHYRTPQASFLAAASKPSHVTSIREFTHSRVKRPRSSRMISLSRAERTPRRSGGVTLSQNNYNQPISTKVEYAKQWGAADAGPATPHQGPPNPVSPSSPSQPSSSSSATTSVAVIPMQKTWNYVFYNLGAYFGMLSFALEQKHLLLPSLRSGLLGSVISLVLTHLIREQQYREYVEDNTHNSKKGAQYPASHQADRRDPIDGRPPIQDVHRHEVSHAWDIYQQHAAIPNDPWAHHGVSHALFSLGAHRLSLPFLLSCSPDWTHSMSFLFTHCFFHVGLVYIELEQFVHALAVFDCCLWQFSPPAQNSGKPLVLQPAQAALTSDPVHTTHTTSSQSSLSSTDVAAATADYNHATKYSMELSTVTLPTIQKPTTQSQPLIPPVCPFAFLAGCGTMDCERSTLFLSPPHNSCDPEAGDIIRQTEVYYVDPSLFLTAHADMRHVFNHSSYLSQYKSTGEPTTDQAFIAQNNRCQNILTLFNYHYYMPTWNVFQILNLLGYEHTSAPRQRSGLLSRQRPAQEAVVEDSPSEITSAPMLPMSYSQSVIASPSHEPSGLPVVNGAKTNSSGATPSNSLVVPLIWKRYDHTYDGNPTNSLQSIMPLRNPTNTQDLTNAIGLLWKLEHHAWAQRGVLAYIHQVSDATVAGYHPHIQSKPQQWCHITPSSPLQPRDGLQLRLEAIQPHPFLPELSPRFYSIHQVLVMHLNEGHQDLFFDVLVCFIFQRCGQHDRLVHFVEGAIAAVMSIGDATRKEQLITSFVPLVQAIVRFSERQYDQAADLLIPIFISNYQQLHHGVHSPLSSSANATQGADNSGKQDQLSSSTTHKKQVKRGKEPRKSKKASKYSKSQRREQQQNRADPPSAGVEHDNGQGPSGTAHTGHPRHYIFDIMSLLDTHHEKATKRTLFRVFKAFDMFFEMLHQHQKQQQQQQKQQQQQVASPSNVASPSPSPDTVRTTRPLSPLHAMYQLFLWLRSHETNTKATPNQLHPFSDSISSQLSSSLAQESKHTLRESPLTPAESTASRHNGCSFIALTDERLACLGGSNEQREVFMDFFTLTLLLATSKQVPVDPPSQQHITSSQDNTQLSSSPQHHGTGQAMARCRSSDYHELLLSVINQRIIMRDSPWLHHLKAITLRCLLLAADDEMRNLGVHHPSDADLSSATSPKTSLFINH